MLVMLAAAVALPTLTGPLARLMLVMLVGAVILARLAGPLGRLMLVMRRPYQRLLECCGG